MTTLTKTHDSTTCRLGPDASPCTMCVWAIQQERNQEIERVHQLMSEDCDCEKHRDQEKSTCCDRCDESDQQELNETVMRNLREAMRDDQRFASVTTIRAAIMDVIDGDETYAFYGYEESANDIERCRFADMVIQRITQLQLPPHNFDERLKQ